MAQPKKLRAYQFNIAQRRHPIDLRHAHRGAAVLFQRDGIEFLQNYLLWLWAISDLLFGEDRSQESGRGRDRRSSEVH